MARLKSMYIYTENLNVGLEFGIREDGAIFIREKYWNIFYGNFSTTKWKRSEFWEPNGDGSNAFEGFQKLASQALITHIVV